MGPAWLPAPRVYGNDRIGTELLYLEREFFVHHVAKHFNAVRFTGVYDFLGAARPR